jgi:hypothetical protein
VPGESAANIAFVEVATRELPIIVPATGPDDLEQNRGEG